MRAESFPAIVTKTFYWTTNDRHLDRGEIVSDDEAGVYVSKGLRGLYYPEEQIFITPDGDEYAIPPSAIRRLRE